MNAPQSLPQSLPLARTDQLLVMEVDGETLVYDLARHRAHCLNAVAAAVWRRCDGHTSVDRIATDVAAAMGAAVGEDVVWYALRRLNGARLIDGLHAPAHAVTRRDLLQRMTAAGLGMLLLPTVASIVAPTTLQAQASCLPAGATCSRSMGPPCCPGLTCRGQPPGRDQGTCA